MPISKKAELPKHLLAVPAACAAGLAVAIAVNMTSEVVHAVDNPMPVLTGSYTESYSDENQPITLHDNSMYESVLSEITWQAAMNERIEEMKNVDIERGRAFTRIRPEFFMYVTEEEEAYFIQAEEVEEAAETPVGYYMNYFDTPAMEGHLTPKAGVFWGPSGKETYYNLPMGGVIYLMRSLGFSEEEYPYWVRSDGVKMFGDYVMVAADLSIRPKGTILESSMGTAIVCDTGDFIYDNKYQLDIAVAW